MFRANSGDDRRRSRRQTTGLTLSAHTMAATPAMAKTPPGLVYVIGRALYVSLTNRCNSVSLPATRGKVRSGRGGRI